MHFLILFVLLILLLFLVYRPVYDAFNTIRHEQMLYNEELDNRIEYMQDVLQRRNYVPLHILPNIHFDTNLETIADGERKCFSTPMFVSNFETPSFDCSALCDDPSASYFFVNEHDKFVVNGQQLQVGGYCTTNSIPRNCNRETSVIIHSLNQWTCIAEDPRYFSGPHNMLQVAGRQHVDLIAPGQADRNILFDRLLNREVDVSRNTFRRDWDELMVDGTRRFEMRCNALDTRFNRMFVNPLNPIECLPNVCTNVNYVHTSVMPNFQEGVCECGDETLTRVRHIDPDDPSSICASIVDRLDKNAMAHEFRVECVNLDMPISQFSSNKLLCPPEIFTQNTDNAYTFRLLGSFPLSGNGINEPTYRQYIDLRNRINFPVSREF